MSKTKTIFIKVDPDYPLLTDDFVRCRRIIAQLTCRRKSIFRKLTLADHFYHMVAESIQFVLHPVDQDFLTAF